MVVRGDFWARDGDLGLGAGFFGFGEGREGGLVYGGWDYYWNRMERGFDMLGKKICR